MKDLKCALKECTFNKGFSCIANSITVDSEGNCSSYQVSAQKLNDTLFEIGADACKPNYSVDTNVDCSACDCLFNNNQRCRANGITVLPDSDFDTKAKKADCATYMVR